MARISHDEVQHIAGLARIAITDSEADFYADELSAVLQYVEQLQEVDVTGIEPTSHVTGLVGVGRTDEPTGDVLQSESTVSKIMAAMSSLERGMLKVRSVFTNKEHGNG
ncbi:MAG: Asp-tRNA(Asn)/Glu-tRNA(Gln) amidotransferase subunit GatC [Candidatus Spechtbacterales bacterium]